jgi:hypothetical protein
MIPDVNVLIAASRTDHPHHDRAFTWLNTALEKCSSGGSLEILPMVASGFLRLVTHPKIFVNPTPAEKAIAFIDTLLATPGVDMPELGREWTIFSRLVLRNKLVANDISDAWIAASVKASAGHLVTFDRFFHKLLDNNELTILTTRNF